MDKKTKINPKKVDTVAALKDKLTKTKAFFITDYRGLTHQQLEQLRKALKKVEAEFVIAKNTLMRIAMKQFDNETMKQLEVELNNPTATFFAFGDEISAIKELSNFIKNTQLPKIKIGLFSGKLATEADFSKLASIPGRNELLTMLAIRLKSPLFGLHYALNWNLQKFVMVLSNIKSKK
ncbi:50S ribosomal protein L10 [Candidatus Gottesmanbacteria bacterium]|nr:50S ribosomal protein L10 [Candidatus Gottesmanbacteria bacterium]MBI5452077.1 50S ribosomal protein L10 [Candidatus Gottesmanbacteria bacterium]